MLAYAQAERAAGRRPGKVIPVIALLMVFLTGMVAFSIDMGHIAETRTELQRTADAGALAGVTKLALLPTEKHNPTAVRAEVRRLVTANGLGTVRDEDVVLLRYDPSAAAGAQFSTDFSTNQPNAVRVTVRRDSQANGPLNMFFAPVIGVKSTNVQATATAYLLPARGVVPKVALIPFVMQKELYEAAVGLRPPGSYAPLLSDDQTVNGSTVTWGPDGRKEAKLYGDKNNSPGNWGSIDIGSASNGTPELNEQLLNGPSAADFADPDFDQNVQNGTLYAPFTTGGDTGLSTAVKHGFDQIIGLPRIIPLYSNVVNPGDNATYTVVGFAAGVVTRVDFNGMPKQAWVQPTALIDYYTLSDGDGTPMLGVYTRPRLIVP